MQGYRSLRGSCENSEYEIPLLLVPKFTALRRSLGTRLLRKLYCRSSRTIVLARRGSEAAPTRAFPSATWERGNLASHLSYHFITVHPAIPPGMTPFPRPTRLTRLTRLFFCAMIADRFRFPRDSRRLTRLTRLFHAMALRSPWWSLRLRSGQAPAAATTDGKLRVFRASVRTSPLPLHPIPNSSPPLQSSARNHCISITTAVVLSLPARSRLAPTRRRAGGRLASSASG
jgi:hypothetical protein